MMDELWQYLKVWQHRKESEKFTTDSNGDTAVRTTTEVTEDTSDPNVEQVFTVFIPTKDTETEIALPDGTRRYEIGIRNGAAKLKLAYNIGDISGGDYKTINRGARHNSDKVVLPDTSKIYLSSSSNNITIEVFIQKRV